MPCPPAVRVLALLIMLCLVAMPQMALAAARSALVIGNSAYPFGPLINPRNDAELMAQSLRQVGFEVTVVLDADRISMQRAILDFSRSMRDTDTVGLFYYAGHGVQSQGQNYLIPVDADIKSEPEVRLFGINVDEFVATLERANGRTNIVILDSCRNNPFPQASRSGTRGLAAVSAPTGTFIAQSTAPGQIALDGDGANSPYATALAKAMLQPGASIEQVFKRTRIDVLNETKSTQTPWDTSSLTGDFYFSEPVATQPVVATEPAPAAPQVAVADPAPVETPAVQEVAPVPRIYPVGKWPEGLAHTGDMLWIAESGSRQIIKLNRKSGEIETKVPAGRLPVSMTTDGEGNVFVAAFTDGKITRQSADGKTKTLTTLKTGYLNDLRYGLDAVYAVSYTEDAVRQTILTRIDPKSGKTKAAAPFEGEARAMATADGVPYVLYVKGGVTEVAQFDGDGLGMTTSVPLEGFNWAMTGNTGAVFVGGQEKQMEGATIVTRLPMDDLANPLAVKLDGTELVMAMAATNERVAVLGDKGGIWILDADTLTPRKHLQSGVSPRAAIFADGILYLTTHQGDGEKGAVYAYEGLLE
jgi:hypothetical protein